MLNEFDSLDRTSAAVASGQAPGRLQETFSDYLAVCRLRFAFGIKLNYANDAESNTRTTIEIEFCDEFLGVQTYDETEIPPILKVSNDFTYASRWCDSSYEFLGCQLFGFRGAF